jgi:Ca-activated chloride channel family protein
MKTILIITGIFLFTNAMGQSVEEGISKGNNYYSTGQYDLAEKLYKDALKKDPDNRIAQHNLANALYRQKKYKEAEEVLDGIVKDSKENIVKSAAHYNNGVIKTKQKDLEGSIEDYKSALRLNPDDMEARENLQKALLELKQKQQQQQQDQKQNQNPQSNINQTQAQQKLNELEEKEKKIQQRMQDQKGGTPQPQDW